MMLGKPICVTLKSTRAKGLIYIIIMHCAIESIEHRACLTEKSVLKIHLPTSITFISITWQAPIFHSTSKLLPTLFTCVSPTKKEANSFILLSKHPLTQF
jgi:hypothetical protein